MSKEKKHGLLRKSELHAISPLALEDVMQHIGTLDRNNITIDFHHLDSDTVLFRVQHWQSRKSVNAYATGRLLRWQGTETRIDVDGDMKLPSVVLEWAIQMALMLVTVAFLMAILSYVGHIDSSSTFLFLIFAVIALWSVIQSILKIDLFAGYNKRARRGLDTLMQQITDRLTADSSNADALLELDGTDTLAELLQRDIALWSALGDDGELRRD